MTFVSLLGRLIATNYVGIGVFMGLQGYYAPNSVDEVISLLLEAANESQLAKLLAGGTDVLVQMHSGLNKPDVLVNLKKIKETNRLEINDREIYIGAAIPSAQMQEYQNLKTLLPGLLEAADLIGSTQVQGRATICGNLCNASPAGDSIPALIAAGAVCDIANKDGGRQLQVEDFVVGVGQNALEPGEFLLGVSVPTPSSTKKDAYLRFIPRTEMDIAVAGAGVAIAFEDNKCVEARIAIGAVAPTARLVERAGEALVGHEISDETIENAVAACREAASPISDKRGTAAYRKKVVGVLIKRAIKIAESRVREAA